MATAMQVFVERLTNQYEDAQKNKKSVWDRGKQAERDKWMSKFRDIATVKKALTEKIGQHDGTTQVGANLEDLLHEAFTEPGSVNAAYEEIRDNLRVMFTYVYNHGFEDGCKWGKQNPTKECPKDAVQQGLGTEDYGELGPRSNHDSY